MLCSGLVGPLVVVFLASIANAATAIDLGTASTFAVLGASTVTNTGASEISGNLGVSPGSAVTGFPPGIVTDGVIDEADAAAAQAQADALTAYNAAAAAPSTAVLTGQDLGGLTLAAGVYFYAAEADLTGTLTLDGQGDPDSVFLFQIGSSLTTASDAVVFLVNGASPCNVFWQVGSSVVMGVGSDLAGNFLALASISALTGTQNQGGLYALNGAVTLDTTVVDGPIDCAAVVRRQPIGLSNLFYVQCQFSSIISNHDILIAQCLVAFVRVFNNQSLIVVNPVLLFSLQYQLISFVNYQLAALFRVFSTLSQFLVYNRLFNIYFKFIIYGGLFNILSQFLVYNRLSNIHSQFIVYNRVFDALSQFLVYNHLFNIRSQFIVSGRLFVLFVHVFKKCNLIGVLQLDSQAFDNPRFELDRVFKDLLFKVKIVCNINHNGNCNILHISVHEHDGHDNNADHLYVPEHDRSRDHHFQ